ncbi:M56 family metallopeptidase [Lachnospiraceae bacterium MD335]|nr:M56 family metallopeptidase [Lachnospiraceae bacterium MD335]
MEIEKILTALGNTGWFASIYWLSKCMKTLLCGICVMLVLLMVRGILHKKSAVLSCYLWLLLLPAAFMGMSRLFYQKYFVYVTVYLGKYIKAWYGYVYFGVMFLLLAVFIARNIMLRKRLRRMPQIYDTSVINAFAHGMGRQYIRRVQIYCSDSNEGPFSGGILNPYIVVPKVTWEQLDENSRNVILSHELTHIRSGHILLLTIMKLFTFLWWVNPLVYVCQSMLREDVELACDECTIAQTGITRQGYGYVLLGMIMQFCPNTNIAVASFTDKGDFRRLKRRITHIGRRRSDSAGLLWQMCAGAAVTAVLLLAAFVLIGATSYPRYTVLDEIYVYGEDLELIACDTQEVRDAFWVEGKTLHVRDAAFRRFVAQEDVAGDYVYVSYGSVMKLPGMGGCGEVVMVNVADSADIWYVTADTIENRMSEVLLKWL